MTFGKSSDLQRNMNGGIFRAGFLVFLCFCSWIVTLHSFAQAGSTESDGSNAVSAHPDDEKRTEEEKELLNAFSFGAAYAFQLNRSRDSATTGEPLRTRDSLGGFVIAYERELLPRRLSLGMSKPFYFMFDRVDTPFELVLKGLFHRGSWEFCLGPVLTWNIRIFENERAEQEGEKNLMSFGIGAIAGASYSFTRHWGLELEVGYEYIPTDDIVEHEISCALSGVFRF